MGDGSGREESFYGGMCQIAHDYFLQLFSSTSHGDISHILFGIGRIIDFSMNNLLLAEFSQEVVLALKGIGHTKVLGEDGSRLYFSNVTGILWVMLLSNFVWMF